MSAIQAKQDGQAAEAQSKQFTSYLTMLLCKMDDQQWFSLSTYRKLLTWKIATALESNTLVSSDVIFPLRTLHLISRLALLSKLFSSCFFFTTRRDDSGSFSSPRTINFCKAEWILLQSVQQNHFPFGNSCWKHGVNTNLLTEQIRKNYELFNRNNWHLKVIHVMIPQTAHMILSLTLVRKKKWRTKNIKCK